MPIRSSATDRKRYRPPKVESEVVEAVMQTTSGGQGTCDPFIDPTCTG